LPYCDMPSALGVIGLWRQSCSGPHLGHHDPCARAMGERADMGGGWAQAPEVPPHPCARARVAVQRIGDAARARPVRALVTEPRVPSFVLFRLLTALSATAGERCSPACCSLCGVGCERERFAAFAPCVPSTDAGAADDDARNAATKADAIAEQER
jgi:hypothetical protein